MIILRYNPQIPEQEAFKNSIESMTLAHRYEIIDPTEIPMMIAYGKEYKGISSISRGILELEQLLITWNQCRCDMFEFEEA